MSIPSHLVSAKIAQARARGTLDEPTSDEDRVLAEMARLLNELTLASGRDALGVRARLAVQERLLAAILERTGQGTLADMLWDESPSYDAFC